MFSFRKKKYSNRPAQPKSFFVQTIEALIIVVPIAFFIRTFFYGLYQVPTGSMETTMLVGERFFADKFSVLFKAPQRGEIITFNDPTFSYSDNKLKELWQSYVWGPSNFTKRVIALPGDEIKGEVEDGKPVIYLKKKDESEFKKLDEKYLNKYPLVLLYNPQSYQYPLYKSYDAAFAYDKQPFYNMSSSEVQFGKKCSELIGRPDLFKPGSLFIDNDGKNFDIFNKKLSENEYWVMGDNRLNSSDSRVWGPLDKKHIHGKIIFRIWSFDSYGQEAWWHFWVFDLIKHPIDFWKRVRWSRCFEFVK